MPSVLETLIIELRGDTRGLDRELRNAISSAESAASTIQSRFSRVGAGFTRVGRNLTIGITTPLVALGAAAVNSAAQVETLETAFTTLLGSGQRAQGFLEELQRFAAGTPFRFPELAAAGRNLLAFGVAADETIPTLRRIGDVSAGIGANVGEIAEIYGKARVQGRLFAEDINQLTGRGIPIIEELARQFGVTESEVRDLVSTGQVGFENLERAFVTLTSEGGKFFGLTAAQAETTAGRISTLRDNVGLLGAEFGEVLLPAVNRLVTGATNLLTRFNEFDSGTKRVVLTVAAFGAALGPVSLTIGTLLTALPSMARGLALVRAGMVSLTASTGALTTAMTALRAAAATLFGPAGILVAAVGVLATLSVSTNRFIRELETATNTALQITGATQAIAAARNELTEAQARQTRVLAALSEAGANQREITAAMERTQVAVDAASEKVRALEAELSNVDTAAASISIPEISVPPLDVQSVLDAAQAELDTNPLVVKATVAPATRTGDPALPTLDPQPSPGRGLGRGDFGRRFTGLPGVVDVVAGLPQGTLSVPTPAPRVPVPVTVTNLTPIGIRQPTTTISAAGLGAEAFRELAPFIAPPPPPREPQQGSTALLDRFTGRLNVPFVAVETALEENTVALKGLRPSLEGFRGATTDPRTLGSGILFGGTKPVGALNPFKGGIQPVNPLAGGPGAGGTVGGFNLGPAFDVIQTAQAARQAFALEFAQVGVGVASSIVDAVQSGDVASAISGVFQQAGSFVQSGAGFLGLTGPQGALLGLGLGFIGTLIGSIFGRGGQDDAAEAEAARRVTGPPAVELNFTTNQYWTFPQGSGVSDARDINRVTLLDTVAELQRVLTNYLPRIERLENATGVETPRGVV